MPKQTYYVPLTEAQGYIDPVQEVGAPDLYTKRRKNIEDEIVKDTSATACKAYYCEFRGKPAIKIEATYSGTAPTLQEIKDAL